MTLTCHQCGSDIEMDLSGFPGFFGGTSNPCSGCGNRVEISNYREWDNDAGSGLWLLATPYTTSKGAQARPIKIRSLTVTAVDD